MRGLFIALREAAKQRQVRKLAVGCVAAALCGGFLTQAAVADGAPPPVKAPATPYGTTTWGGLGWGIGIAADFDLGGTRVTSATVVNNIVRVTDSSSNVDVSFVLEAHYFLRDYQFGFTGPTCTLAAALALNCSNVATGPFVALEIGGGSSATPAAGGPITGYALGWMVGLQHPTMASTSSSWNFGVGLRIDPKAQVLGDGLVANQPLPAGDSIRYKTEPRTGIMLVSSFSF